MKNKRKNILANISARLFLVLLGKLLAFASLPIITRTLGTDGYGTYILLMTIGSYASILCDWGFLAKGIRDVAAPNSDTEFIVSNLFSSRIILWAIGALLTIIISSIIYQSFNSILLVSLAVFSTISTALQINFFYYGKKQAIYPSVCHLLSQVFFIALVLIFIHGDDCLVRLLTISVLYPLLEIFLLFIPYMKANKLKVNFSIKKSLMLFKENFDLGLGAKLSFLQNSIPIFLIPLVLGKDTLGIYAAAYKICALIVLLLSTINLVFSPWIVQYRKHSSRKQKQLFCRLLLVYIGIAFVSIIIVLLTYDTVVPWLFGKAFISTGTILAFMALFLIPAISLFYLMSMYINNYSLDKNYLHGALMQALLALILIPLGLYFFNLQGAIIGIAITYFLISMYYGFNVYKCLIQESSI